MTTQDTAKRNSGKNASRDEGPYHHGPSLC